MAKIITVNPDDPLDRIGQQILIDAGIMDEATRVRRGPGVISALARIMTYLNLAGVEIVTTDGAPYDPADAVRAALKAMVM